MAERKREESSIQRLPLQDLGPHIDEAEPDSDVEDTPDNLE